MGLKLITGPTSEPIDLADAKLHLRIQADQTDEDALIATVISAARQAAEHELGRSLMPQTWELALDTFPYDPIVLPRSPIMSITSVKYLDQEGALQTVDPAAYVLDDYSEPARLARVAGASWPHTSCQANAVLIRYTAGYVSALAVPAEIKQWMLLQIGAMYENREAETVGHMQPVVLGFADRLLDRYRVY